MGPGDLHMSLKSLPSTTSPNVIMGWKEGENAGIFKLSEDLAIVQTIDFITPMVNEPYLFGQIAAANALSDVYAMGGKPITALNIVCFPKNAIDISVLEEILRGGVDKVVEAEASLLGGHSIYDEELKYGLSVTGTVHPEKIISQRGARVGDKLILTKPIGTGIICDALKTGNISTKVSSRIVKSMTALNKRAAELMQTMDVHACTDITGFGLLGHASEIALKSRVGIEIYAKSIPTFPRVKDLAKKGIIPGATSRNREFYGARIDATNTIPEYILNILFDPQTSGGLLISCSSESSRLLLSSLHDNGLKEAALVGEVIHKPEGKIVIR